MEGAVRNWFEEEEGGDGKRSEKCLIDFNYLKYFALKMNKNDHKVS